MNDASEMKASIFDWAIIMLSKLIQCDCLSQLRMWYTFNVKKISSGFDISYTNHQAI